jgi:hypothetical protein
VVPPRFEIQLGRQVLELLVLVMALMLSPLEAAPRVVELVRPLPEVSLARRLVRPPLEALLGVQLARPLLLSSLGTVLTGRRLARPPTRQVLRQTRCLQTWLARPPRVQSRRCTSWHSVA